ncbi:MAG TPA: hypothetical protein PLQ36_01275 [Candidatus Gracilibacteria bacterium]|nr:hypothetical protein [Candidatus Gracilibacteria bacterium]
MNDLNQIYQAEEKAIQIVSDAKNQSAADLEEKKIKLRGEIDAKEQEIISDLQQKNEEMKKEIKMIYQTELGNFSAELQKLKSLNLTKLAEQGLNHFWQLFNATK